MELQINRPKQGFINENRSVFDKPEATSVNTKKSVFDRTAVFHSGDRE